MSLRLAAHKSRRGFSVVPPPTPVQSWTDASSRAAQAAARVAARYAQVPSFSQLEAAQELTTASRAASSFHQNPARSTRHIASEDCFSAFSSSISAAVSAPAPVIVPVMERAVEAPFAAPQPATVSARPWEPELPLLEVEASVPIATIAVREPMPTPAHPAPPYSLPTSLDAWEFEYSHTRWEPDPRMLPLDPIPTPPAARKAQPAESFAAAPRAAAAQQVWASPALIEENWSHEDIQPVEPDLPIHANLIEFPRELIATRKMRPRRAEGPFADGLDRQLSIFEVDPGAISIDPVETIAEPPSIWHEPEWSGIELEPETLVEPQYQDEPVPLLNLELAPFSHRLTAALVDGALVTAVFVGAALVTAVSFSHAPAPKIVVLSAVAAYLFLAMLYQTIFLTLDEATPGMYFAGISLCTFDSQIPTQAQLRSRLGALLLSVLPMGLGLAWALFDEDHLSWHDRLSHTYLRKC